MTDQRAARILGFYGVRFETLHQSPFFAPLFGYTRAFHKLGLATRLNNMAVVAQRLLTPDEVDAVAHYHALQLSRSAWAPAATLLTTAYMTHRRRNTFRFPLYTPKPTWFDPWCFPTARTAFLVGPSAVRLWHVLRFGAYGILCHYVVGKYMIMEPARQIAIWGMCNDDRLDALDHVMVRPHVSRALEPLRAELRFRQSNIRASRSPSSRTRPEDGQQAGEQHQDGQHR